MKAPVFRGLTRFVIITNAIVGISFSSLELSAKSGSESYRLPRPLDDKDFYDENSPPEEKVFLGNLLFFDKELSGNRNISCATCHHPLSDLGDGLSLPVGEGALGLGITRNTGEGADSIHERVPRNAPPVFSMGVTLFDTIFHDGRIQKDPDFPSGIKSPAGDNLPEGLDNVLAAQAMFPVTSGTEMAGQAGENEIADAAALGDLSGEDGVWSLLTDRLKAIPMYVEYFIKAFDDVNEAEDITFVHAANAIAAFEAASWPANNSRFDDFLRGDPKALTYQERRGMKLFYGKANCVDCHSGPLLSDFGFYAIAMPQVGPGKGVGIEGREDFGRELVTGDPSDRYKFRTPTLRNVALTAPYGHSGAFNTLEGVVRHHLSPVYSLYHYNRANYVAPYRADLTEIDFWVMDQPELVEAIADANELKKNTRLRARDVGDIVAFLKSLTDSGTIDLRHDVPSFVPSGLPIYE